MASQSSRATSRLAALSLSPSRIAQLGVKHDSDRDGDTPASTVAGGSSSEGKAELRSDGSDEDKGRGSDASTGPKEASLSVPRPEMSRRSSTLDSLSDEGDDAEVAEGYAVGGERTGVCGGESGMKGEDGNQDTKKPGSPRQRQPSIAALQLDPSSNTTSTSAPGSSRQRSPPPSYEHAILPSALYQSSLPTSPNGRNRTEDDPGRTLSARARGKQRDVGIVDATRTKGSRREDSDDAVRGSRSGGGGMLELLPNSDTSDGEEVFSHSRTTHPDSSRISNQHPHLQQSSSQNLSNAHSTNTPSRTNNPASGRRKRPLILGPNTRARSSYTGPVVMIDRSGEGWTDTITSEEDVANGDTALVSGYAVTPDAELTPTTTRPSLVSSSSSFIRSLPSPSSGAFTQDVRILGWKIVGGRTGRTRLDLAERPMQGTEEERERDGGVEELEKPRMGAYVVYECEVLTRQGTKILRLRRYNEFLALYMALKKAFPNAGASLPPLPPKNRLSKFEPTYLAKRQVKLQFWLKCVLLHPQLGAHEAVRRFVVDV